MNDGGVYMLYDQMIPAHVRGGQIRASTAVRDQQGRFMPVEIERWGDWQLDPEHGRRAGQVNAATARRDQKGRFA